MPTRILRALLAVLTLVTSLVLVAAPAAAATTSYYVDCATGADAGSGRSAAAAWRSIDRANSAALRPGDKLLLKRGCTWRGQRLDATWHGTAAAPIVIGNYGSGAKPVILDGKNQGIKVTGSHQVLRGLQVDFGRHQVTGCGQPVGNYYGVNFTGGAHHNTLTHSEVRHATAGVHLSRNSEANRIVENTIANNDVAKTWTSKPGSDLGAWGILVVSDRNEIAFNTLRDNAALCRNNGFRRMSNSVEIFEGRDNHIHHNRATGDRVFSELGSSSAKKASGNVFAYNLHDTEEPVARFITTRGSTDAFGPVTGTYVFHNTVHFTGAGSQGVVCSGGCGGSVLTLDSNIIWAEEKVLYADGPVTEGRNVFWNSTGMPLVQAPSARSTADASRQATRSYINSSSSVLADPSFTNAVKGNFRLNAGSPALDRGKRDPTADLGVDLARMGLPAGATEAGAFERR